MEGQKEVDEVIGTDPHGKEPEQVKSDIYTMPEEFYVPVVVKSKKLLYIILNCVRVIKSGIPRFMEIGCSKIGIFPQN